MKLPFVVLGGLILAQPVPLSAQERPVSFSIGERQFSMPVPEGYCTPEGPLADRADRTAEADTLNITAASLFGCDEGELAVPVERYFMVKTSRAAVDQSFDKATWLARWETAFRELDVPERDRILAESEAGIERSIGSRVEIQRQSSFLGRDDEIVCTGGTYSIETEDDAASGQSVMCLTVRGQRAISLHFFDLRPGEHIESMRADARSLALSIQPVP